MRKIHPTLIGLLLGWSMVSIGAADSIAKEKEQAAPPPAIADANVEKSCDELSAGLLVSTSAAEVKIEKALDEPTELEFIEAPLTDVIDFLKKKHGIEIQIDSNALEESGVATDTQITRNVKRISLRSALRLVLRDLELDFIVRDEVLLITTEETARSDLRTRIYRVDDLVAKDDFGSLIEVIVAAVAPASWEQQKGLGSIRPFGPSHSLVVHQTLEVQRQICQLLTALRKARDAESEQPRSQNKGN